MSAITLLYITLGLLLVLSIVYQNFYLWVDNHKLRSSLWKAEGELQQYSTVQKPFTVKDTTGSIGFASTEDLAKEIANRSDYAYIIVGRTEDGNDREVYVWSKGALQHVPGDKFTEAAMRNLFGVALHVKK